MASDLIEVEDIWLTQKIHVAGENLCHNGQYIFFKDKASCEQESEQQDLEILDCEAELRLSPISFMEKISLPNGASVTHFFNIKTEYEYTKYELTGFYPLKNYDLVETKQVQFPICAGMKELPAKKITKERMATETERPFISGLVHSGVTVINSPYGFFKGMAQAALTQEVFVGGSHGNLPTLKSPLCNNGLDYKDILIKTSGEWSGHGIVQLASLNEWQNKSNNLVIKVREDMGAKKRFDFYCLNEESYEL